MPGHGEQLSRKQELALAALLSESTVTAAATKVGVSERTLRTWLQLPAFREAFTQVRRQVLEVAVTRAADACGEAVEALRGALTSERVADRIAAARVLLDQATRGVELLDVAGRVEAMEEMMTGKRRRRHETEQAAARQAGG
jgi:hypothetical protein